LCGSFLALLLSRLLFLPAEALDDCLELAWDLLDLLQGELDLFDLSFFDEDEESFVFFLDLEFAIRENEERLEVQEEDEGLLIRIKERQVK
jgi:hypothetical protein